MINYIRQRILWLKNSKDKSFPNKCDICGLRAKYPNTDKDIDASILKAGELQKYGLAISYPRNIHASFGVTNTVDYTYFCSLSNLKYWNKPYKKCPDWQLQLGSQLTLSDHLAIHHSNNNTRIAFRLGVLASLLTILNIVVGICNNP